LLQHAAEGADQAGRAGASNWLNMLAINDATVTCDEQIAATFLDALNLV
jgi:hypothetical protein